ncbi:extracellular solute-binding protein [Streptomyces lincolnensis]|uniref:Extracellular solute-binding protein n=1 Tax=Streptomyces lincolnensis TaxID=1915 RepID=A0A1B1M7H4_STRLN|nr:sugar ABC transporter substrate-binding protein [Streptomyces lincolnensis]ANS64474.1 extracellular solute-binding protein [Streptomyces lincolnensis]AXG57318.1 extracellular solute-binding protein [Streptomyces lincolnensis]QMV06298.1 extracellular solute-binding protein [Streptomyces lincolnensis]
MKASQRNNGPRRIPRILASGALGAALLLAGCGGGDGGSEGDGERTARGDTTCDGRIEGTAHITVWFHAGPSGEYSTLRRQVEDFNKAQEQVRVELVTLPEQRPYNELVLSAAASGDLPDLLDFDGPRLYSYAWSGELRPMDSCVSDSLRDDLLPSIRRQGTYAGRLYGVGTFDSGMGLYVRPSVLKAAGVRVPRGIDDAWTAEELTGILRTLRDKGHPTPLDLGLVHTRPGGEWATYGFAPALWSAGGDLIEPGTFRTADGFLNGPESVGALTTLQNWVREGLVEPGKGDQRAFLDGRSVMSWTGHWWYPDYSKAFPDDVAIVPLPDFGEGTVTGMGSWQWGIPVGDADGDAVRRFLDYLLTPEQVHRMTTANGAVPATNSAVKLSSKYRRGGAEHLFIEQLRNGVARPRPQTPAYPAITDAFAEAFRKIMIDRAPVRATLDEAVEAIDKDLAAHDGYPPRSGP